MKYRISIEQSIGFRLSGSPTLSGRMLGSSQVMKNGFGALPASWNRDIAATDQVSLPPSGLNRNMRACSWSSLFATCKMANYSSGSWSMSGQGSSFSVAYLHTPTCTQRRNCSRVGAAWSTTFEMSLTAQIPRPLNWGFSGKFIAVHICPPGKC